MQGPQPLLTAFFLREPVLGPWNSFRCKIAQHSNPPKSKESDKQLRLAQTKSSKSADGTKKQPINTVRYEAE